MKEVTQRIYRYTELNDEAQEKVRNEYIDHGHPGAASFQNRYEAIFKWLFGDDWELLFVETDAWSSTMDRTNIFGRLTIRSLLKGIEKASSVVPPEGLSDYIYFLGNYWDKISPYIEAYGGIDKFVDVIKPRFKELPHIGNEPSFGTDMCKGAISHNLESWEWRNYLPSAEPLSTEQQVAILLSEKISKKAYELLSECIETTLTYDYLNPNNPQWWEDTYAKDTWFYKNGDVYVPDEDNEDEDEED